MRVLLLAIWAVWPVVFARATSATPYSVTLDWAALVPQAAIATAANVMFLIMVFSRGWAGLPWGNHVPWFRSVRQGVAAVPDPARCQACRISPP